MKNFDFETCMGYEDLKILLININLSTFKICNNGLSIINIKSNIKSILYFCKTVFK